MLPPVQLLGPQRFQPTVAEALGSARGTIAVVTAGWQEREHEVEELDAHVARTTVNLSLYRRCEEVFREDRALAAGHRARQDRVRQLQELYRIRLEPAQEAARTLLSRDGEAALLDPERAASLATLRDLDAHHLLRIDEVRAEFEEVFRPGERPAVLRHRRELAAILEDATVLLVAGGHVAILLNRLRLFDIQTCAASKAVIAWSAGAMALGERVVLFHDFPAQGAGTAEVLDAGLGVHRGLVALPHARRRLDLADTVRVALFARRFHPAACVALDDGARLGWDGAGWHPAPGVLRLGLAGTLAEMERA